MTHSQQISIPTESRLGKWGKLYMPEISVLVRPRQEDYHKSEVALSYTMRLCLRNKTKSNNPSVYGLGVWASEVKTYEHRIFFSCQGYGCCFCGSFKKIFRNFPLTYVLKFSLCNGRIVYLLKKFSSNFPVKASELVLFWRKSGAQATWLVLCLFHRPFLKDVSRFF